MHDTQHDERGLRVALLRLSALGFAALTGMLAFMYISLTARISLSLAHMPALTGNDFRMLVSVFTLPVVPGAFVSWWVVIVLPKRSSALAGGCAGLLTIVLAVLGVCIAGVLYGNLMAQTTPPTTYTLWQHVEAALFYWPLGLLFLCGQPWGWGIFLVGISVSALYGALIRRILFLPTPREAPLSNE